ncbi:MAG TPA: iron ABC transporter permease [Phycisphaerales bacterium]|nr:iron ABC transporter permease [Phycisphaerales bacterium]HMP37491.1 iron ABC transporter permease [Phycisphaerales bacterium]
MKSPPRARADPAARTWRRIAAIGAALAALVVLRLFVERPLGGAASFGWPEEAIRTLRMTAIAAALSVGAALGVAGVFLQGLLRNPLAEPFILGVSGGAGLGVTIALAFAWAGTAGSSIAGFAAPEWLPGAELVADAVRQLGLVLPAAIGGIAALVAVIALGQRRGAPDPLALVLAGVVVSTMCGAVVLLLQHLSPQGLRSDLAAWMIGRIPEAVEPALLVVVSALAIAGVALGAALGRSMDAATFGDDEAHAVGVPLRRLRWTLGIASGLLAAAAVTVAGPIAFVGLVAPHLVRSLAGARHAPLVVGAALAGGALLLAADILRQLVDLGGGRIPVGIFAALAGGPVFLVLLRRGKGFG